MIGSSLALGLDEDWHVSHAVDVSKGVSKCLESGNWLHFDSLFAIPRLEWLKDLQTIGSRRYCDRHGSTIFGWSLVGVAAWIITIGWQAISRWYFEFELLAFSVLQRICKWVEVEGTGQSHGNDKIW